jgi:hypothetical protein
MHTRFRSYECPTGEAVRNLLKIAKSDYFGSFPLHDNRIITADGEVVTVGAHPIISQAVPILEKLLNHPVGYEFCLQASKETTPHIVHLMVAWGKMHREYKEMCHYSITAYGYSRPEEGQPSLPLTAEQSSGLSARIESELRSIEGGRQGPSFPRLPRIAFRSLPKGLYTSSE